MLNSPYNLTNSRYTSVLESEMGYKGLWHLPLLLAKLVHMVWMSTYRSEVSECIISIQHSAHKKHVTGGVFFITDRYRVISGHIMLISPAMKMHLLYISRLAVDLSSFFFYEFIIVRISFSVNCLNTVTRTTYSRRQWITNDVQWSHTLYYVFWRRLIFECYIQFCDYNWMCVGK